MPPWAAFLFSAFRFENHRDILISTFFALLVQVAWVSGDFICVDESKHFSLEATHATE